MQTPRIVFYLQVIVKLSTIPSLGHQSTNYSQLPSDICRFLKGYLTLKTSVGISGVSLLDGGMASVSEGWLAGWASCLLLSPSMHCSLHSSCLMFVRLEGVLCLKLGGLDKVCVNKQKLVYSCKFRTPLSISGWVLLHQSTSLN